MGEIEKMTLESESLIDDRLNKLKELYESGLITREEYDDKRREILQDL